MAALALSGVAAPVSTAKIGRRALPGNTPNDFVCHVADRGHSSFSHLKFPSSMQSHTASRETQMSLQKSSIKVESFGQRLAQALRSRIGAGTTITIKQLAYALQVTEQTVWNWLSGNKDPRGEHLIKLIAFFDESFANEIFAGTGATIVKIGVNRKLIEAAKKLEEALSDLKNLGATHV